MQATRIPGVWLWSQWQNDRQIFFHSHFINAPGGNLIVDPLPLSDEDEAAIEAAGGAAWIVVTNRDHERAAAPVAQRFGARLAAGRLDAPLLSLAADRLLDDGDTIGGALVVTLDGMKSPGEIALVFAERATVLVGDALWGAPAGDVSFPPKIGDVETALLSLRRLAGFKPQHLLVGDGAALFGNAYQTVHAFLASRREAYVNRINLDQLPITVGASGHAGYRSGHAEIGSLIGAEKLGYRIAEIPPGEAFCPMHWHTIDEELFIVWDGNPTLLTPRGEIELRRGDFVAFPSNASGAHKIVNRGDASAQVIMIASELEDDVCFYPDSQKLLVSPGGVLVASAPQLDYYHGEAAFSE